MLRKSFSNSFQKKSKQEKKKKDKKGASIERLIEVDVYEEVKGGLNS